MIGASKDMHAGCILNPVSLLQVGEALTSVSLICFSPFHRSIESPEEEEDQRSKTIRDGGVHRPFFSPTMHALHPASFHMLVIKSGLEISNLMTFALLLF